VLLHHLLVLFGNVWQSGIFVTAALGHDAIVECDAGTPTTQFIHFKRSCGLLADIQSFAVAVGREEDVIVDGGVDGLSEVGVEADFRGAALKLSRAVVLIPVLGGLDPVGGEGALVGGEVGAGDGAGASQVGGLIDLTAGVAATGYEDGSRSVINRIEGRGCGAVVDEDSRVSIVRRSLDGSRRNR
jgi:hypothetical protein